MNYIPLMAIHKCRKCNRNVPRGMAKCPGWQIKKCLNIFEESENQKDQRDAEEHTEISGE